MKRLLLFGWCGLLTGVASAVLSPTTFGQIQITEVMYDASYDDVWEWIEITNTGASAVNLDGYLAFPLGQNDILPEPNPSILSSIDPDTTINAGETMIIYDSFYANGNPNNHATDSQFRSAWGIAPTVKVLGAQFWPAQSNTPGNLSQSIGFWPNSAAWRQDMDPVGGGEGADTVSFNNAAFSLNYANFPVTSTVNGHSSITWTGNGSNQDGANWVQSVSGTAGAVTSLVTPIGTGSDVANPGIVSNFATPQPGLYFTEIMFDPSNDSTQPIGEWVELYNNTGAAIDLAGYTLDDKNEAKSAPSGPNIASGTIPAGGVAILYPSNLISAAEFEATWGPGLNLIGVTGWDSTTMGLNNSPNGTADANHPFYQINDSVALWASHEDYLEDGAAVYDADNNPATTNFNYNSQAQAVAKQAWGEGFNGFASAQNASITLGDLSGSLTDGANWPTAALGDVFGSEQSGLRHPGGDVGSPGTFQVQDPGGQDGDFDGDGDVDGRDFLTWQRDPNVGNLADWQNNYGMGSGLAAIGSVPEPTALALLALALVPAACGRKR